MFYLQAYNKSCLAHFCALQCVKNNTNQIARKHSIRMCVFTVILSLVPRRLKNQRSAWYPLFAHARKDPLHFPYNLSRYVRGSERKNMRKISDLRVQQDGFEVSLPLMPFTWRCKIRHQFIHRGSKTWKYEWWNLIANGLAVSCRSHTNTSSIVNMLYQTIYIDFVLANLELLHLR